MGYRIDYALRDATLRAVVPGRSSLEQAAGIARDITAQASSQSVSQLLIDVRALMLRWLGG